MVSACLAVLLTAAGCSGGQVTPTASASFPGPGSTVALGTNDPPVGDCATNTSEAATSVGSVVLDLTPSAFTAQIRLQGGSPNTTYGVFMQQVPGSCPQPAANGGSLTTDSAGGGQATATVPRVQGATTFFIQLVPGGTGPGQYTSDRIAVAPQQ